MWPKGLDLFLIYLFFFFSQIFFAINNFFLRVRLVVYEEFDKKKELEKKNELEKK